MLTAATGCKESAKQVSSAPANLSSGKVELMVDYGDGVQKRFTQVAWSEGLTVYDALKIADEHPRGLELSVQGSGDFVFLHKVDDVENGVGDPARYWTFWVNGKKAQEGMGAVTLQPSDIVEWRFAPYNPEEEAPAAN